MNRRKITAVVSLVVLVAAVAGVSVWLARSHHAVRSFLLPDGTRISFYQATYGTNHEAIYATDWRDRFARFVPARYATNLGFKRVVRLVSTPLSSSSNNLVVWVKRSGLLPVSVPASRGPSNPRVRATVVDENGLEATTAMSAWDGTLMALLLPNYPRRSAVIHVRFWNTTLSTVAPADQPLLAELEIPNPAPSSAAPWVAEALPVVRVTNGLEISLLKLETGKTAAGMGLRTSGIGGGAGANSRTYSLAEVELRENGQPTTGWSVRRFRAAAPTGASLTIQGVSRTPSAGANGYYFTGVLWPEEPVWDFTVEVGRQSVFPSEETWSITGIPVPRTGDGQSNVNAAMTIETNMFGVHLALLGLSPRRVISFSSASRPVTLAASTSFSPGSWTLNLTETNYSPDVQLGLLSLQTDTGESIRQNGSSSSVPAPRPGVAPTASYGFDFVVPDGAKTIDATFSVSKLRTATFRVKPTLAN